MNKDFDEHLIGLFKEAEAELPGVDFKAQVMIKVKRHNRKTAFVYYASRLLMLSCLCALFPSAVKMSIALGDIMGNLPSQSMNFLRTHIDSPAILFVLIASAGYLLLRFRLFRLPETNLFSRISPFKH